MKKWLFLSVVFLFILSLTVACGAGNTEEEPTDASGDNANGAEEVEETEEAAEITVSHDLGETVVEKNPETVVTFDFGSLDTLDALGVEVSGVPQMNIPTYLEKYEGSEYENVGGLKEPDFEKLATMEPDLIIISGRQQDSYEEFSKIAPTIFMGVDTENYMASFEENVTTLASIFEKEEEAQTMLDDVKESIATLNEKASNIDEEALIILANDGKVSAYGSGSRFGLIHDVFGFKESDENIEASTHGQSISFEYITKQDPDFLFVIDRTAVVGGETSAEQLIENELTENIQAYEKDQIVYLDPEYWYLSGGGLQSVAKMVEEVEAAISE
ncbi:siderophore ABC transporter substrate-binding protein [Aliibacillus thermotolerans]|uniref:Siderophore ABC transporter substrate-binding protein n=1 Tax=Aliibacillus thermotolerans TaxID=1834418 RepID=A0ABW0U8N5_9BACI|nr:siderophore ABC transporter substrate-binding protein [Aliibacillus thermotolerans]MDA3130837.1 ABC transporter substrate-binding protein [Aliibacillus thermotolerans]